MCEFCVKHGDGKKWYLAMKNYAKDLRYQENRIGYMGYFANTFEERMPRRLNQLERLSRTPLRNVVKPFLTRSTKRDHFGQIVPIEDVEKILLRLDGISRLSCPCRRVTTGQKQARYCFALTADPQLAAEIDDSYNLEVVTSEAAIESVRALDEEGLIHTVWTFKTPYIGALCNCDQDCLAYRISYSHNYFRLMFRSEYVAGLDKNACNGCRNCMRHCNFGAIRYSAVNKKVKIDARQCFGCGVCRAACHKDAIILHSRSSDRVAAEIW